MSQQRATVVGLVGVELAPLRRCLERGSRAWCLVEGVLMDKQILENNIKGLKKARDACRSQLDIGDRKSTRLNSSHQIISYAVFCLKKKKKEHNQHHEKVRVHQSHQNRAV